MAVKLGLVATGNIGNEVRQNGWGDASSVPAVLYTVAFNIC